MPTTTILETRIISGVGRLLIPFDASNNRRYTIYANVLRLPTSEYKSFEISPPESLYARITFLNNGYVRKRDVMSFPSQIWTAVPDVAGQVLIAVQCMYEGILQTFVNLGIALSLVPISVENTIDGYLHLGLEFDEVRFSCYKDTALEITLVGTTYDVCDSSYESSLPTGEPPIPPELIPTGTPVETSPPYEDEEENPITNPFPGDAPPPPEPCVTVLRGAGLNTSDCGTLPNFGDYTYAGYAELMPITFLGCPGLRVFLDGVDLGEGQTYHPSAIVLSRTGDCEPPI